LRSAHKVTRRAEISHFTGISAAFTAAGIGLRRCNRFIAGRIADSDLYFGAETHSGGREADSTRQNVRHDAPKRARLRPACARGERKATRNPRHGGAARAAGRRETNNDEGLDEDAG
jgi:hypothetical protein